MEVYEGSGTSGVLELPVSRNAGAFGVIGVSWLATTVSASTLDFNPQSGNITFQEGQVSLCLDDIILCVVLSVYVWLCHWISTHSLEI